jgi:general secretion pathway protein K
MKPVKFQSETEFAKTITTESKMFSIYAVGVKKGYRRETRVKVHTVVDFRAAPALGATTGSGVPGTVPTSGTSPTTAPSGTTAGLTTDGFAAAVRPATGGQTVHFRVE